MRVRRLFRTRAVGHTGTLDPFATGLLVLVLGGATRLARFIAGGRKEYVAEALLGQRTDTDDRTGQPLGEAYRGSWPGPTEVRDALTRHTGLVEQRPPAFSAKRLGGERSYDLARAGLSVALAPVAVAIDELELTEYEPPQFGFRAVVGPGTYVRAIARDVGDVLGTGAHLTALRRERVGRFRLADATAVEQLTGAEPLLSPRELVAHLREVGLDPDDAARVAHGQPVGEGASEGELAALVEGTALVAVGQGRQGRWQPVVVLGRNE